VRSVKVGSRVLEVFLFTEDRAIHSNVFAPLHGGTRNPQGQCDQDQDQDQDQVCVCVCVCVRVCVCVCADGYTVVMIILCIS